MIYADTIDQYTMHPKRAEWGLFDDEQNHAIVKRGLTATEGEAHNAALDEKTEAA